MLIISPVRWDPHRANPIFFKQSALLHMNFYHLQLLIHRPFIATNRKPSPLSFPSLAICTNAARASVHVIDLFRKRKGLPFPIGHFNVRNTFPIFKTLTLITRRWWSSKQGLFYFSTYGVGNNQASVLMSIKQWQRFTNACSSSSLLRIRKYNTVLIAQ